MSSTQITNLLNDDKDEKGMLIVISKKERKGEKQSTAPPLNKAEIDLRPREKRSMTPLHAQTLSLTTGHIDKSKTARGEEMVIINQSYKPNKLMASLNITGKGIPDPFSPSKPKLNKNSSVPPELFRTNLPKLRQGTLNSIGSGQGYESHMNLGRSFPHLLINSMGTVSSTHANVISMKKILPSPQQIAKEKGEGASHMDFKSRVGFASNVINNDKQQSSKVSRMTRDISYLDSSNYPRMDPLQYPTDITDAEFFISQHLKNTMQEHISFMGAADDSLRPIRMGSHIIRPANLLQRELSGIYGTNNIFDDSSMLLVGQKLSSPTANKTGLLNSSQSSTNLSRIPLLRLGNPSGRKQVEMLNAWVDEMLITVNSQKYTNVQENYAKNKVIYQFAMLELNRQVSVHCIQRGELLRKVLDGYLVLVQKTLKDKDREWDVKELKQKKEKKEIRDKLRNSRYEQLHLKKNKIKMQKEIQILEAKNERLSEFRKKLFGQLDELGSKYKEVKDSNQELIKELNYYKNVIDQLNAENTGNLLAKQDSLFPELAKLQARPIKRITSNDSLTNLQIENESQIEIKGLEQMDADLEAFEKEIGAENLLMDEVEVEEVGKVEGVGDIKDIGGVGDIKDIGGVGVVDAVEEENKGIEVQTEISIPMDIRSMAGLGELLGIEYESQIIGTRDISDLDHSYIRSEYSGRDRGDCRKDYGDGREIYSIYSSEERERYSIYSGESGRVCSEEKIFIESEGGESGELEGGYMDREEGRREGDISEGNIVDIADIKDIGHAADRPDIGDIKDRRGERGDIREDRDVNIAREDHHKGGAQRMGYKGRKSDHHRGGESDHHRGGESDHHRGESDHHHKGGESDHHHRGESDHHHRGESDHHHKGGESDHHHRGESDHHHRGESDHKEQSHNKRGRDYHRGEAQHHKGHKRKSKGGKEKVETKDIHNIPKYKVSPHLSTPNQLPHIHNNNNINNNIQITHTHLHTHHAHTTTTHPNKSPQAKPPRYDRYNAKRKTEQEPTEEEEKEQEIENYKKRIRNLEKTIGNLESECGEYQMEIGQLSNVKNSLQHRVKTQTDDMNELMTEREELKQSAEISKWELESTKDYLKDLAQDNLKLGEYQKALKKKVEGLRKSTNSAGLSDKSSGVIFDVTDEIIDQPSRELDSSETSSNESDYLDTEIKNQQRTIDSLMEVPNDELFQKPQLIKRAKNHPGDLFFKRLFTNYTKSKKKQIFLSKGMSPKMILKLVTNVYTEQIAAHRNVITGFNSTFQLKQSLMGYAHDHLFQQYGIDRMAEQKLSQLIKGAIKYADHCPRITLFNNFINEEKCEIGSIEFYLKAVYFLNNLNLGIAIQNKENAENHYFPYVRCLEFARKYFEEKLPKNRWLDHKKKVELMKISDQPRNQSGKVDLDAFLTFEIEEYQKLLVTIRDHVADIFRAADLDGNNYIELVEFLLVFKHIEPEKYTYANAKSIFEKSSEHFTSKHIMGLSFAQFAVVCTEFNLFQEETQFAFCGCQNVNEIVQAAQELHKNFDVRSLELQQRLKAINMWFLYFIELLNNIKLFASKRKPRLAKIALLMFKVLDQETNLLYIDGMTKRLMGILGNFTDQTMNNEDSVRQLVVKFQYDKDKQISQFREEATKAIQEIHHVQSPSIAGSMISFTPRTHTRSLRHSTLTETTGTGVLAEKELNKSHRINDC